MSLSSSGRSLFKSTTHELLVNCDIPFDKNLPVDQAMYNQCKELLESKFNYPLSLYPWFEKCLHLGVDLAGSAFSHLPKCNQIQIAFFTTTVMALDDHFRQIQEQMEGFSDRLVKGLPQNNPILATGAQVLSDMPHYYGRLQSNLIVTSMLDFVSSLMIDTEIQKMTCLFCSDVLSLYKEELEQDEENYVPMLAKEAGITKYEALKRRADEVVEANKNILKGLAGNQPALDCWLNFKNKFAHFHISSSRYKLNELFDFTEMRKSR
ncbi:terpenoid synthase [Marasmius fiardii PR-910]|nr:terpenoid synthase [Marasmius fiardii PR-910]